MRLPGCKNDTSTTVWAHSNRNYHGKGIGQKSDDLFGAYLCAYCHDRYDYRVDDIYCRDELEDRFNRAMAESQRKLIDKGILK